MNKSVLKGFAVGALVIGAIGYVVGIMTAPASGKDTRSKIYKLKKRSAKKAAKDLKSLRNQLDDIVGEADIRKAVDALKKYTEHLSKR